MKKDNILIFIGNINSALMVATKLLEEKKKNKNVSIIIERRYSDGKIKFKFTNQYSKLIAKIFSSIGYNSIYFYNRPKNYEMFSIKNVLSFYKIKKKNEKYKKDLINFIRSKKININLINDVWFSNDLISKIFLNNFKCSKSYFFHGLGDIMILKKKNLLFKLIDKFKFKLNNYFYGIYFVYNCKKIKFYNLFIRNYDKKIFNSPLKINNNYYKKILFNISKKYKKLIFKKKIILITDNIILQKLDIYKAKKFSQTYIFYLKKYFKKNKINYSDYIFIFKWKGSVPDIHNKIFKNKFKENKLTIKDINEYIKDYIPLEFLIPNLKPQIIMSYYSTINFFLKDIFPKIKIINTINIYKSLEKDYLAYHEENKLNKLLKNSEEIKKLVKVPYDIKI